MLDRLRRQWRSFRDTPPGQRFQQRYRRRAMRSGVMRKTLLMMLGAALIVLGVAMLVLPGPGLLAIVVGASFIGEESLWAARLFDRIDLAISRRLARRALSRRAPRA